MTLGDAIGEEGEENRSQHEGRERGRRGAKWHDRTCEEGGEAGKRFLLACNLCTQGGTAMPQRCTCRSAVT